MMRPFRRPSGAHGFLCQTAEPVAALRLPPATLLHPFGMLLLVTWICCSSSCTPSPDADLPAPYRDIAVPNAQIALPGTLARGAAIFQKNCVICHGATGDGHGIRSQALTTRPRDFTDRSWRERTTPRHVYYAIREGVRDTAMPSWRSLSEDDSWAVTAWVLSLAEERR